MDLAEECDVKRKDVKRKDVKRKDVKRKDVKRNGVTDGMRTLFSDPYALRFTSLRFRLH